MAESAGQAVPPKAPVKGILKKGERTSKKGVGIETPREGYDTRRTTSPVH